MSRPPSEIPGSRPPRAPRSPSRTRWSRRARRPGRRAPATAVDAAVGAVPPVAAPPRARRGVRAPEHLLGRQRVPRTSRTRSSLTTVKKDEVKSIEFDPSNGDITGTFKAEQDGTKDFTSSGPNNDLLELDPDTARRARRRRSKYKRAGSNFLLAAAPAAAPAAAHRRRARLDEPPRRRRRPPG